MAPEKKDKKRKATTATVSDPPAKKTKKVEVKAAEAGKDAPKSILKKKGSSKAETNGTTPKSTLKVNGEPARQIKPRKRAADFLSDDEDNERKVAAQGESDKAKSDKKKAKTTKKAEIVAEDFENDSSSDAAPEEEDVEDDQTAALIKGFESSGDEDASDDEGFDPDQPVPKIPDSKKAKRKILKKQKNSDEVEEPGAVYVGRIPHGFYEHQMRAYFSQFGEITRLRLSRNRITGRSKHYAFIEFASASVAKIVAETMDNYLMFGHILKCKFVPQEQLHPEIWKGANRRFKRTPWNRIEKKRLEKGKSREKWAKSIEQEQKKRLAKAEKLKELGYELELPQLKSVDDVPAQEENKTIGATENGTDAEPTKAIEAAPAKEEAEPEKKSDDTPKKSKKDKKAGKSAAAEQGTPKQDSAKASKKAVAAEPSASPATKAKKAKSKSKNKV